MNLHEYQGKSLFAAYNLPVSKGKVIFTAEDAIEACNEIGGKKWVVKAQVHAGGRGKSGGVELIESPEAAQDFAEKWLGNRLVTYQTDSKGQIVNSILIEDCTDIAKELYLSAVIDRESQKIVFIGSSEGGVNIEEVAKSSPEKIIYQGIDLDDPDLSNHAISIGNVLKLNTEQQKQFTPMLDNLVRLFVEKDLSLLEINPLVITQNGDLHCLDAKLNIDSNALFRQPDLLRLKDPTQEDQSENDAAKKGLNYVSLNGNIACLVNGAGLAMATMDLIKLHGGEPANFLDVGGGATSEKVSYALKLILANENVQAILVNIFGGIVRCDLIAQGIIDAVREIEVDLPVVVRLEGTNVEDGKEILKKSGHEIITATDLTDAAKKVIEAVNK